MEDIVNIITSINGAINSLVWGIPMIALIICTGVYMTVRTQFFQLRRAKEIGKETLFAIFTKKSVTKTKDKKAITQFQSLTTALASTIGTGNIAGVATAIAIGGPGAVFWMWISAFFGMMTIYSENVLGIYFRKRNKDGEWSGGSMYYIEEGLKDKKVLGKLAKPLSITFALFCVFASFGIGNMTQVNSISSAMESTFNIPTLTTGIILAVITALVIFGGIKRIGKVTEKLVPFMALIYIAGTLIIFFMNFKQIPYVFYSIFSNAFSFLSIAGGVGGYAINRAVSMGFKRGIFSNEAGLGSSVMVHCASDVKEPVVQGMWGIFEVFIDTIVVCTLTAFVLLSSTCDAVTMEEALSNVSTSTQYFRIYGDNNYLGTINLIDSVANESIVLADKSTSQKDMGVPIKIRTENGQELIANTIRSDKKSENDYIYTNIMSVKGIPKTDANGKVQKDENGKPVLKSVNITPVSGVPLVGYALSQHFGHFADKMLAFAILLFAFSTVLGWSFYGTKSMEYIFGTNSTIIYKVLFISVIIIGATMNLQLVWDISDTLNALMAIPNLIGVLSLSGLVIKITKNYTARKLVKKPTYETPMYSAYPEIQKEQEKNSF
ncbi:MAG: sodium:alanine symporter family protein [Clostridia bacterium]|nr:sodium:alanine symporter family protein [Clostridia bacterium]